ncbi:phage tail protein [Janthinobacterium sp. SUN137]|uniref:phage tail protein n=1 Tax=Janthinobacterium sp. SUN137 TaxID=3014789 RepID=UPI00271341B0|nr:tail fiber protein [Janthinobacterium sp. SUN137]MDO8040335.1 tail fiber protein [Janthinobacterium sp. SUN137]
MKSVVKKHFSRAALIAGIVSAAWTPNSFACTDSPVLASICIMAVPFNFGSFNRQYVVAAGQDVFMSTNAALYSLIGNTYGATTNTTFKLPDLRGKFVVGANGTTYLTGNTGGNDAIKLSVTQLPPHSFTVSAIPVQLSNMVVSVDLPALNITTAIAAATATGTVTDLKMNVANTTNGVASPSGAYLGKAPAASSSIYASSAPDATLNAGAISGGNVSVSVPASTASMSLPAKQLTGTISGTAAATGQTSTVGSGEAFDNRPSYIALTYYIAATNGLYPSRD